jgi:hypothetical protein
MTEQFPAARQWDGELELYAHRLLHRSSPQRSGPESV